MTPDEEPVNYACLTILTLVILSWFILAVTVWAIWLRK